MESTSFEVCRLFPMASCYPKLSWFHDVAQLFYLQALFLKNDITKTLDKKSPPLFTTIPVKLGSSPSQQELNDVLQIFTGIYMHRTLLPMDGVRAKRAVPIGFWSILAENTWLEFTLVSGWLLDLNSPGRADCVTDLNIN